MKRRNLLKYLCLAWGVLPVRKARAVDWSYEGNTASSFWGKLDPEFATCAAGKAQSPINLESSGTNEVGSLELNYQSTPLVVNNNRTIRVDYQPGSNLVLDGKQYELLQFHFHQPSEHAIAGQKYDLEAHLVHRDRATGDFVVLAVLMSRGKNNQALEVVWQDIPQVRDRTTSDFLINAIDLLPEKSDRYYRYQGSLTTPPCSENVTWLVLKQPVEVSKEQIDRFVAAIGNNARPLQALNSRILLESK